MFDLEANYTLGDAWAFGALISANLGSRRSDFGSLPEILSGVLTVRRYF